MQVSDDAAPLYAKVQSALRTAIRSGALGAGAVLPSEKELEAAHGVSRITIRRALEELEREGLVVRGRGRQARVVEPMVSAIRTEIEDDLATMLELVRGTEARVLTFKWRLPDPALQLRLRVPEDEPVLQVDRLRGSTGRPMLHTIAHMPAWVGTRLRRETLSERTMLETLAQGGIELATASQEMHAAPCPAAVAPLIGLSPDDPVFIIERLVSDKEDRPVQQLVATFRWDSFSYRITSTGSAGGRRVEIAGTGRIGRPEDVGKKEGDTSL
jgi:GntR family transcriptional regulator